jgi:hypothetical protein
MQIPTDDITRQVRRAARQVAKAREQLTPELPEKLVLQGLGAVKNRARRRDLVGEAAYRTLRILNQGLTPTARTLTKIAEAVEPPVQRRSGATTSVTVATPKASTSTARRRTTSKSRTTTARKAAPKTAATTPTEPSQPASTEQPS